ncbi:YheC/YheD family protein [Cohnella sp. JJ-181]|uniref:YheC/YheD family protein n=1 Tax=Cohnella rhizoplanae TaxID=2974897 RepID=UPI0022FFADD6|nr:YheC/YheD family protein [Cohnella sp. JJ-181]CAI6083777.1 hypothetical protein COHCIP112018_04118 [Cohnella sp. JJ-181]
MRLNDTLTIAMMCEHPNATRLKYACASVAKLSGVGFFYFVPDDVDVAARKIKGYTVENNEWVSRIFDYPDAIYDRACRMGKLYGPVYEALAHIPISTDKPANKGSKLITYRKIMENGLFAEYMIPSAIVSGAGQIGSWLHRYRDIVVKPVSGTQGKGLFCIRTAGAGFEVTLGRRKTAYPDKESLLEWLAAEPLNAGGRFLVQPFIRSATREGNPFDIRAHLSRNGEGKWGIVKLYPRIGSSRGVISNISAGGHTTDLKSFYQLDLGKKDFVSFQKKLSEFSIQFAEHYQGLLDYRLQEMGLDLGIDASGKMWLFEVNLNRLGTMYVELEAAQLGIPYTIYLAKQGRTTTASAFNTNDKGEWIEKK